MHIQGRASIKAIALIASLPLLAGCEAALAPSALPVIVSGAGGGISYTITNIAYKATTFPINAVDKAVMGALKKMSIKVVSRKEGKNSTEITAKTSKLDIFITLEALTPTLTMIRVNAEESLIIKDKATAYEIIYQTEKILGVREEAGQAPLAR